MNEIRNLQEKIVQDQASKCSSDNSSEAKTEQDTTTAPTTTTTSTTITSIGSANNTNNNNNLLTRKTSAPTPSPSPSPKIGTHQPSATANASNSFKMTSFSSIPTNLSKTSTNASLTLNQNSIKNGLNALSTTSNNNNTNGTNHMVAIDETPNKIVYKKMEIIIEKMQEDQAGVPIRTVKSFMSKIPSVFTGSDLIQWMLKKLDVEDACESLHLAHLFASNGYIFPIDDHILTVKNDGTFFRFQVSFFLSCSNNMNKQSNLN